MPRKAFTRIVALILFLNLAWLPTNRASADIGPKPTVFFDFSLPTDLTIVDGDLLVCQDEACLETKPLDEFGAQEFSCDENSCHGTLYGIGGSLFRLKVLFSDGQIRLSNPFLLEHLNNSYKVQLQNTDLVVRLDSFNSCLDTALTWASIVCCLSLPLQVLLLVGSNLMIGRRSREAELPFKKAPVWYLLAWGLIAFGAIVGGVATLAMPLNLLIELGIAALYLRFYWHRKRDRIESRGNTVQVHEYTLQNRPPRLPLLTAVATVNLISQPLLWITMILITDIEVAVPVGALSWPIILAEIGVWLFEAWLLHLTQGRHLRTDDALELSLFMNLTSFGIGLLLAI